MKRNKATTKIQPILRRGFKNWWWAKPLYPFLKNKKISIDGIIFPLFHFVLFCLWNSDFHGKEKEKEKEIGKERKGKERKEKREKNGEKREKRKEREKRGKGKTLEFFPSWCEGNITELVCLLRCFHSQVRNGGCPFATLFSLFGVVGELRCWWGNSRSKGVPTSKVTPISAEDLDPPHSWITTTTCVEEVSW